MTNKAIINILRQSAALCELHEQAPQQVRLYQSSIFALEKLGVEVLDLDAKEWARNGLGAATKILEEIRNTQTLEVLDTLLQKTPEGILEIMQIKGLGAKKVRSLWKDLQIDSIEKLKKAALNGEIAKSKGFGEKTQENILKEIAFIQNNSLKRRYADAQKYLVYLEQILKICPCITKFDFVGEIRRKLPVIHQIEVLVESPQISQFMTYLQSINEIQIDKPNSSPFVWRGVFAQDNFPLSIKICSQKDFVTKLFENSAAPQHFQKNLLAIARSKSFQGEEQIYAQAKLPYFPPELREGMFEFDLNENFKLIQEIDLKGVIHCHSTYSDGKNSLEQMAKAAQDLGYEYLGISDHSQAAFYANGLSAEKIRLQHQEIEELNQKNTAFKIFKGIEADILADGSLDYEDSILASFDFVIASIHSNLNMDISTATQRLLKAIANPYTTILGHPTGRLLLKRNGYPIDYQAVIEACAKYEVAIEINANPYRLDLDWTWVNYAIKKGVKISINPDAHSTEGYQDTQFGVAVARKAGLEAKNTLNALNTKEIENYFWERKKRRLALS